MLGGGEASALWQAAASGDSALLSQLLRDGDGVNARVHGHTALMTAAQNGHTAAVRLLCDAKGVDLRATTDAGRGAIHLAAEAGHAELVALLADLTVAPAVEEDAAIGEADGEPEEQQGTDAVGTSVEADEPSSESPEQDELTRALSILPEPCVRLRACFLFPMRSPISLPLLLVSRAALASCANAGGAARCARRSRRCSQLREQLCCRSCLMPRPWPRWLQSSQLQWPPVQPPALLPKRQAPRGAVLLPLPPAAAAACLLLWIAWATTASTWRRSTAGSRSFGSC
jgi:hypothetical protein